jgi:hypothetical protein
MQSSRIWAMEGQGGGLSSLVEFALVLAAQVVLSCLCETDTHQDDALVIAYRNWKYFLLVALDKILGVHGRGYEECRLLIYKIPVRTSPETHYVSTTESSRLMLCKIWGFHRDDYEECRLLGYKNPVRTSQKAHYVSATEPSQLMLCKIWGFHGGDYEECCLLRYYAVWLLWEPTFRRNLYPPS